MSVMALRSKLRLILLLAAAACLAPRPADAYSLLTHEQLIDLTWKDSIVPLLLSRYPNLTAAQLEHARAYAYGGCVIQDIGYYPLGDAAFSNLTHYVRTGDFVVNLFRNAGDADGLAFAVGALAHYIGDTVGHSEATNLAVPVEFHDLAVKYGKVVSYAEGKHQHVQVEFAFDIHEISHNRLAPVRFLRHVGLKVPTRQLALAFYQTYGLTEDFSGSRHSRINVGAYRFAVHDFIPNIAYAVNLLHSNKDLVEPETAEAAALDREVARIAAENDWKHYTHKPGIGTYTLAGLIFILPKIGPLKMASVKGPTTETEAEYIHSVTVTTGALRMLLARFTPPPTQRSTAQQAAAADPHADSSPANPAAKQDVPRQSRDPHHPLSNRDLDTGRVVQPGGYPLTDDTYASLLHRLTQTPQQPIPPGIKEDIATYYSDLTVNFSTKKNPQAWKQLQTDLATLATMPTSNEPDPYKTYNDTPDNYE
jgi:hypothetical protein